MDLEKLKYPIGPYKRPSRISPEDLAEWTSRIQGFPQKLVQALAGLEEEQLDWVYRPGGWTIRQVVHHCADSHMNSLIRYKLALTEDKPVIKPYLEDRWAELVDVTRSPVEDSLRLLEGLHRRWVRLLTHMGADEYARTFVHPEYNREISLGEVTALYAWHCEHHLGHVLQAKAHQGAFSAI